MVFVNQDLAVNRMSAIEPDGAYIERSAEFAGLPVGKSYHIAITSQQISPGDFVPASVPKNEKLPATIPEKYRSAETSGLTAEVKEGTNPPFDFNLEP